MISLRATDATTRINIQNCIRYEHFDNESVKAPVIDDDRSIEGVVFIGMRPAAKIDHQGIYISLVGQIEYVNSLVEPVMILNRKMELLPPGTLRTSSDIPFVFDDVQFHYESYNGQTVRLRYFVKLSTSVQWSSILNRSLPHAKQDIIVYKYTQAQSNSQGNSPVRMEVGIDSCLHIEFELSKKVFYLDDVIDGQVKFNISKLRMRYMELDIIRIESVQGTDTVANSSNSDIIARHELMDGPPARYTVVPVRLYLSGQKLTCTYNNCMNKFTVKYYLNLVLVDEEDRRYFKRQEITLLRRKRGS